MNRGGASGVDGRASCGRRLQSAATCFCSASHAAGVYQSTRPLISAAENLFWITLRAGVLAFTHGTSVFFLANVPPTQHIYVMMTITATTSYRLPRSYLTRRQIFTYVA